MSQCTLGSLLYIESAGLGCRFTFQASRANHQPPVANPVPPTLNSPITVLSFEMLFFFTVFPYSSRLTLTVPSGGGAGGAGAGGGMPPSHWPAVTTPALKGLESRS